MNFVALVYFQPWDHKGVSLKQDEGADNTKAIPLLNTLVIDICGCVVHSTTHFTVILQKKCCSALYNTWEVCFSVLFSRIMVPSKLFDQNSISVS